MSIVVFTGPTFRPEVAGEILDAVYLPPVGQGDLYRAALTQPLAIGIVDGYFQSVPALWHKEILWAMSRGIHVFGSASLGALRAAELEPFGMIGVGEIFKAYRDGVFEDDDEVAVVHGPPELNYLPYSDAMVNIRYSLAAAVAETIISRTTGDVLIDIGKSLFYPDRSYWRILAIGMERKLPATELTTLTEWLAHRAIDQKRRDARAMITMLAAWLQTDPAPKKVSYRFAHTSMWQGFVRQHRENNVSGEQKRHESPIRALLKKLHSDGVL